MYLLLAFLFHARSLYASTSDYDFFVRFSTCKTLVAPMTDSYDKSKGEVIQADGDLYTLACKRKAKRRVDCTMHFDDSGNGIKGNVLNLSIVSEMAGVLTLSENNGADYIQLTTSLGGPVVAVSRILSPVFTCAKVCRGIYVTADELKSLINKKVK